MYRNLNADLIVDTCRMTQKRVSDRFTDSGLSKVAGEIVLVSEQAAGLETWLSKPHLPLRALAGVGIVSIFIIIASVAMHIKVSMTVGNIGEFLQGLDAAINEVVFIGIAAFFFLTLETRLKRQRALKSIRELRSLAHIIDMHQLTKDPERIAEPISDTARIAKRPQNPAELIRYLDHCSDLLALILHQPDAFQSMEGPLLAALIYADLSVLWRGRLVTTDDFLARVAAEKARAGHRRSGDESQEGKQGRASPDHGPGY